MKSERGITLVALVVTIVVLLILAGVTITYALSDNGIFKRAQESAMVSEQATVRDAVSNAQAEALIEHYDTATTDKSTVKDLVEKYVPSGWTATASTATIGNDGVISGSLTVTSKKYTHTVTVDSGSVTEITSAEVQ